MRYCLPAIAVVALAAPSIPAQIDRDMDRAAVRRAIERGASELEDVERRWRQSMTRAVESEQSWRELFGYNPPGRALTLGWLSAYLFEHERKIEDGRAAARYLARMAHYRDTVPEGLRGRVEYADGLPAVPSFFHLGDYAEAWLRIRTIDTIDGETRKTIEDAIAQSADFVFVHPEWGPHNRAMLRAESLLLSALAVPAHARASRWRQMAEILAADSKDQWEIEDAQVYHPIWLQSVLRYAALAGDDRVFERLSVRYYLRYFQELLSPAGTVPDFGDAWWNGSLARYYVCLELGAAGLADPELKWAANRVYAAMGPHDPEQPSLGRAVLFARLDGRMDTTLEPRTPTGGSGSVLDDVIGKKLVFRTGRGPDDLYLLLNYRDEGDWGVMFRDYLRQTLAVEEEKMHHGNADENAIVLLMDRGSLLLHDAGYRERAPSGPFGAFRGDIYHNRLVVRDGKLGEDQSVLEFLRDSGAYRKVRTEKIDFVAFDSCEYGRTRVVDADRGYTWDRTIVFPKEPRLFVVFDTVRIDRDGYFTLANLWATKDVVTRGEGWALGSTDRIERHEFASTRQLLVAFPGAAPNTPGVFPLRRHRQEEQVLHETRSQRFERGTFATFVTVLWPVAADTDPATAAPRITRIDSTPRDRTVAVQIATGEELITIGLKVDLTLGLRDADIRPRYDSELGSARYGYVATDADFVITRVRGDAATWCATNMTHVRIGDESVFAAKPFQVFQTTGRSDVVGKSKWRRWEEQTTIVK